MTPTFQYLTAISPGPLFIVRLPVNRKGDIAPRWRDVLKATTPIMRGYGLRQKDLRAFDALLDLTAQEADELLIPRLEAAYGGDKAKFPTFDLYDWKDGAFVLVRKADLSSAA